MTELNLTNLLLEDERRDASRQSHLHLCVSTSRWTMQHLTSFNITIKLFRAPVDKQYVTKILGQIFRQDPQESGYSVLPQTLSFLEDALSIPSSVLLNTSKRRIVNKLVLPSLLGHRFLNFYLSLADVLRIGPNQPAELHEPSNARGLHSSSTTPTEPGQL